MYECTKCAYISARSFNVKRHFERIHTKMEKPRLCCGKIYKCKDKYYKHCERRHPNTRVSCKMSRLKYKISNESDRENRRIKNGENDTEIDVSKQLDESYYNDNFQSSLNETTDFNYEMRNSKGEFSPPVDESSNDKENLPNEYLNFLDKFDFDGMKVAVEYNEQY